MDLIAQLVAVVAPPSCPGCRAALRGPVVRLCPDCSSALPWISRRACPACGLPGHRGRRCPAAAAAFSRAWSPLAYDGVARELVAALKFRGALPLAGLMTAHMAANLPSDLRAALRRGGAALVPVPAQPGRRRRRGFDPAYALTAGLAARLAVPVAACLSRHDRAPRQVGTDRAARRRPGRMAIELHGRPPRHAILVDDVHTTGSTLDACARVLRAGGSAGASADVAALSYARAL